MKLQHAEDEEIERSLEELTGGLGHGAIVSSFDIAWRYAFENYKKLAPALNADTMRVPLLREYGSEVGVQSLEFYMALRRLGKPVEQIIYPGAPHVFDKPSHRRTSLERNLDWFRF